MHDFFSRPLSVQDFFCFFRGEGGEEGVMSPAQFFLAFFLLICVLFFFVGGGPPSAAIFNNLDAPHNLNSWNRLQSNINFIMLHTLFCFTINIKQKYQWFIISFIRCL